LDIGPFDGKPIGVRGDQDTPPTLASSHSFADLDKFIPDRDDGA
jgi:hypothetical protein